MSIVSVRGLSRDYVQGVHTVHALRSVDLDIEPGEFTVLMGPSGSGKSTLLNLIGGLDQPTAGSVKIEDADLATMTPAERSDLRRDRLGFVFQAYNLIPVLTAEENIEYVMLLQNLDARERKTRVSEMLELGGSDADTLNDMMTAENDAIRGFWGQVRSGEISWGQARKATRMRRNETDTQVREFLDESKMVIYENWRDEQIDRQRKKN